MDAVDLAEVAADEEVAVAEVVVDVVATLAVVAEVAVEEEDAEVLAADVAEAVEDAAE